ncbi:MAG: M13 family metallopeptidase [Vicingaceae bacterium]
MTKGLYIPLAASLVFIIACGSEKQEVEQTYHAINMENIDTTVRPQDDFFLFVNGNWVKNTEIPADQGSWGSFNELREANNDVVLDILERAAANKKYKEGSDQRKAADFYAIGMDSARAEEQGVTPIIPIVERINGLENKDDLLDYLAYQSRIGGSAFFGFSIFPDLMNSDYYASYIAQDGLGLPDKDYYTKTDAKSVELREKYVAHTERMMKLSGIFEGDLAAKAAEIFALENQLALVSMNRTEQRNIPAMYNPYPVSELKTLTPSVDWNRFLKELGLTNVDTIIVMQPEFMKEIEKILVSNDLNLWKDYLKWNILNTYAGMLNQELVQANFDFYGKELSGTTEMRPRWKRVLSSTNGVIGEAIGKLYVDEVFPPEAKATAKEMVDEILEAMGDRIKGLEWMTDTTKEKALEKLASFTVKIGYPDKWKDYSKLDIKRDKDASYAGNLMAARNWSYEDRLSKMHDPVDKTEWGMTPQTVNAYYSPLNNEIVFPAAILQPPFFDFKADAPINFGGIGAVIGHEISHGFDDNGSRFDANGNMINWWTEEDLTNFKTRGEQLVAQYNSYEALDSLFVNGQLTLGENIGDLGGVNLAWEGMQRYFAKHGKTETIDGFTPEQRFFMSWGTIWRTKYRDEALRTQVMTNPHSPGMFRANGPLTNVNAFYQAFDVKEGDGMYKAEADRIVIW